MKVTSYRLDADFRAAVGEGDPSVRNQIRNLEEITDDFVSLFHAVPVELPLLSEIGGRDASPRDHLLRDLAGAHQLIGRRIADLLLDLTDALNRRRLLVAALVARGLLESAALCVYVESKVRDGSGNDSARGGELLDFLHRITGGGRFDWMRAQGPLDDSWAQIREYARANSSQQNPEPPEERLAYNVLTMLKALDRKLATESIRMGLPDGQGVVLAVYAILSDFCHPAVGNTTIYQRLTEDRLKLRYDSTMGERQVRWIWDGPLTIVAPALWCARSSLNAMAEASGEI